MTYHDSELSVHGGKPVELFKFEGTYEDYFYTSGAVKMAIGNDVYLPVAIQRAEIVAGTTEDDGLNIDITMPVSLDLVQTYAFEQSPPELNLTIYRQHAANEMIVYWSGPVSGFKVDDGVATATSNSVLSAALSQDFPNVYFQSPCNHILFDTRCKVKEELWSYTTSATAVNGRQISVAALQFGGQLVGGELRNEAGERRTIVAQVGNVVTVNFGFSRLAGQDEVTLTVGCDHGYQGDCKSRFNNQKNYGGFPFISTDNPFTDTIEEGTTLPDQTCTCNKFEGWYWKLEYTIHRTGGEPFIPSSNLSLTSGDKHFEQTPATTDPVLWKVQILIQTDLDPTSTFNWQMQYYYGSGSDTVCYEFDPSGNGYCVADIQATHWTDGGPTLVAKGYHYRTYDMNWKFALNGVPLGTVDGL